MAGCQRHLKNLTHKKCKIPQPGNWKKVFIPKRISPIDNNPCILPNDIVLGEYEKQFISRTDWLRLGVSVGAAKFLSLQVWIVVVVEYTQWGLWVVAISELFVQRRGSYHAQRGETLVGTIASTIHEVPRRGLFPTVQNPGHASFLGAEVGVDMYVHFSWFCNPVASHTYGRMRTVHTV